MKYSFVIPTYNNAKLLLNTLEALNHMRVPEGCEFEVNIVDDGSDIDTLGYISNLPKKYSMDYQYVERCEDSSRARARNYGIRKATGDVVIFIDADIIVCPNYLEELERYFRNDRNCIVIGTRILLQKDVTLQEVQDGRIFRKEIQEQKGAREEFRKKIFEDLSYNASNIHYPCLYCQTCNLAVPREKLMLCNGFDEDLKKWGVEDVEMAYRVIQNDTRVVINSRNIVMHQFHGIVEEIDVKQELINDVDYNADIFIRKHHGAFGLDDFGIKELFRSIAGRYGDIEHREPEAANKITLEFRDEKYLSEIQDIISKLITYEQLEIIVIDYNEKTDLDVWIQNLACRKGALKYYPASRVDLENIAS